MKQKNFDAQQLYKEYMQTVSSDPAAIGEILSGERQPVNHGARIKHSTGKMATVTAAAAVIAVCAGIGLSNMNANDTDSKVKSAASTTQTTAQTTTPAVTTAAQTTKEQAPAKQEAKFKTELVELNASDHGMIAAVKLTALNDAAKTAMKTKGFCIDYYSENKVLFESLSSPRDITVSENELIVYVDYVWSHTDYTINNGDVITVLFKLPSTDANVPEGSSESDESALKSPDRHISITIKKNKTERVFKSKDGKTIRLSDYHYRAENVSEGLLKSEKWKTNSVKFADGTVMTGTQLGMLGAATTTPDAKNKAVATFYFENHIDSSKVVSITYEGVEYTPQ